jgi:hypothetical protein
VLVDVVVMLEVAVAVVNVIHVITMGDRLAAVCLGVRACVIGVYCLFGMVLLAVHVVDVVVMLDGLASVALVMLVIGRVGVGSHLSSFPASCQPRSRAPTG